MPVYAYLADLVGAPFGALRLERAVVGHRGAARLADAGYLACLVLYRMLRMRLDETAATWAALFFAAGPLAALFQVGYAESLFLLWLFLAAVAACSGAATAGCTPLIPLMGFTRPGVLAFALFLGLYGISRWVARSREPLAAARGRPHRRRWGCSATARRLLVAGDRRGGDGASGRLPRDGARVAARLDPGATAFIPFEGFFQGAAFWFGSIWGLGRADRLHRAGGIRPGGGGPPAVRAAREAARHRDPAVGGQLSAVPAGGVLPAVQPLPAAGAGLAAVGSGGRSRAPRSAASACWRCAWPASGGGSTTCTRWRIPFWQIP